MYRRSGVTQTVAALAIVVVILAAAVGYAFIQNGGGGTTTSTATTTVTGTGSTATVTSTSTSTKTSTATSTATSTTTSTATSTTTTTSTSVTTQLQDLAAAGQAECASAGSNCLTILTTQSATNWASCYGPSFYAQYPWANGKVTYQSLSTAAETTQLISAYQAHAVQTDVATGTLAGLMPAIAAGAMLNYTTPEVGFMNYSSSAYGPAWITTNIAIVHMIYNPKVMAADKLPIPKSWSDLANPVYKNQIAFQTATALGITTA